MVQLSSKVTFAPFRNAPLMHPRCTARVLDMSCMSSVCVLRLAKKGWQLIKSCCSSIARFCAFTDASRVHSVRVSCRFQTYLVCVPYMFHAGSGHISCAFWTHLACVLDASCTCSRCMQTIPWI